MNFLSKYAAFVPVLLPHYVARSLPASGRRREGIKVSPTTLDATYVISERCYNSTYDFRRGVAIEDRSTEGLVDEKVDEKMGKNQVITSSKEVNQLLDSVGKVLNHHQLACM
ncbi:hypothetical protein AVEN_59334-1 [Araneus ventricosus]|uniref:Uncharacterized protein n=1 Tax=Araneus ventricosus TaxID=182803 RepID=A0A4Y2HPA8_ARAVE|nr:hypothetical protein AVEN_59334-1 [Araneus ventricosus]